MAYAIDPEGKEIGHFDFSVREDLEGDEYLKLFWAYLDLLGTSYKHQGIGREILKGMRVYSGMPITAENDDGHRKEDGSHLTGDAPGFVNQMRKEGLICPDDNRNGDNENDDLDDKD